MTYEKFNFINYFRIIIRPGICLLLFSFLMSCKEKDPEADWVTTCVTATAYNSLGYQTAGNPTITAFGDTLEPGMNAIAVSRDLLRAGLDHNTKIKIEGFDGVFLVKDKMHYRWKKRIDIYMGENAKKARKFGRKKINISYRFPKKSGSD